MTAATGTRPMLAIELEQHLGGAAGNRSATGAPMTVQRLNRVPLPPRQVPDADSTAWRSGPSDGLTPITRGAEPIPIPRR
jgi:hypothetical protein